MKKGITCLALLFIFLTPSIAQFDVNTDESKVPSFTLPSLLLKENGRKISTPQEWEKELRPKLLSLFADQEYGVMPAGKLDVKQEIILNSPNVMGGKAQCKQVKITFIKDNYEHPIMVLMYLPVKVKGKVPVFLSYNFEGNHTVCEDIQIIPTSDRKRGSNKDYWPIDKIISAGYGLVTIDYNQFFPDYNEGHRKSILRLFGINEPEDIRSNGGQAISTWAWGLSRIMDYLETDPDVDSSKVILMGHSRQGKVALWAGAQDERFAIVISNDSGCGGAALSKRCFGETVGIITSKFPYWFCPNFSLYANKEQTMPFDQHGLLALIAPRPLYVASAEDDSWSDPKGEFLAAKYAGEVYSLYGYKGILTDEMPPVNTPIMNQVGYHIRTGKHAVTDYDWEQYIKFTDKHLKN